MKATQSNLYEFAVLPEQDGLRLDQFLTEQLNETASRSKVKVWIQNANVSVKSGEIIRKPAEPVKAGQVYLLEVPDEPDIKIEPVEIDFSVLYEDDDLAVIHKPPGIAVHAGPGQTNITLANGILHRFSVKADIGNIRPGIVHRLDMPTEGVMVVARNSVVQWKLSRQFQNRTVEKKYTAWICGPLAGPSGTVDLPIARNKKDRKRMSVSASGRNARTDYFIEEIIQSKKGRRYCLLDILLHTGRTHQIRVHLSHLKSPVVGDQLYSRTASLYSKFGLLLFARELSFDHPVSGQRMSFSLPLPERFLEFQRICRNL